MANSCNNEVQIYNVGVLCSLFFTFALSIYVKTEGGFVRDPAHGRKIFFSCGTVKILIGVSLSTVLYPVHCRDFFGSYGAVAIAIGIYWLVKGGSLPAESTGRTNSATVVDTQDDDNDMEFTQWRRDNNITDDYAIAKAKYWLEKGSQSQTSLAESAELDAQNGEIEFAVPIGRGHPDIMRNEKEGKEELDIV